MSGIKLPQVIQGGMGINVSTSKLANMIARLGGIGVVSGTGIAEVITRTLQKGGPEVSKIFKAASAFPDQEIANEILIEFLNKREPGGHYCVLPKWGCEKQEWLEKITLFSAFVVVWLAKQGSPKGMIGINLMHKITAPLPSLMYGAMLAGVDVIFVGAGIPTDIPKTIDRLSRSECVEWKHNNIPFIFKPNSHGFKDEVKKPLFGAIVSSNTLAKKMTPDMTPKMTPESGGCDLLVLENHTAGGHNAPPRGKIPEGKIPDWGEKDLINLDDLKNLNIPIYLAGGYGNPEGLESAQRSGFTGIQAGSIFALSEESGFTLEIKEAIIRAIREDRAKIESSFVASPTGYPFKVLQMEGTMSDPVSFLKRKRSCGVGLLREVKEVKIDLENKAQQARWSCSADPRLENAGSQAVCLCEALLAVIGLAQVNGGEEELPIITLGEELKDIKKLLEKNKWQPYPAEAAYNYIMGNNTTLY